MGFSHSKSVPAQILGYSAEERMTGIIAYQNIFPLFFYVLLHAALLLSTFGKLQWCRSLPGT